ncbi:MAG: beta-galactosidase [Candidatus Hydrogenedentes bacterium]|nr:beta-galactosidase [Candidatus Hydrogenedentota bacterium]
MGIRHIVVRLVAFVIGMIQPLAALAETDGIILFQSSGEAVGARLENVAETQSAGFGETTALHIFSDTDPYQKVTWDFRFSDTPFPDSASIFLEIEHFDDGAGVIQPTMLVDDAFNGTYATPVRGVSFTRLNQQRVRRALFEFANPRMPATTTHPHLRIAGLQGLIAVRAYDHIEEDRWRELADAVPVRVEPMLTLDRPMQITCTIGIPDTGDPPSLETALNNIREFGPLARLMGFTSAECFVRWNLIEPAPGHFDFTHYDTIVRAITERGLQWFPNLVITSAFALPEWYLASGEAAGFECLEHGEENAVPTIWNSANLPHVERVLRAFGAHYGPMGVLEAVRLGPSGNFGEAQYPAGAGSALGVRGARMHGHVGWWAGDDFARAAFQKWLRTRYGTIDALNRAWDTHYARFEEIAPQLPETYRTNQGRLDMTGWYTDSMTAWCDQWAHLARAALPDTPIYQSSGGWGFREAGTDFSGQADSMRAIGNGGIRLTNETDSFEQNFYATRLAATAARLYGIGLGYEPAGYHSARGVAGRFFSTLTTNGDNLYTRHNVLFEPPYAVDQWRRDFCLLDERANPIIDVAVYYPETMNQLDSGSFRHLYAWGFNTRAAEVRRRIDNDFLDERLIREGYLDRYKVLVFCWGAIVEPDVQQHIDQWIRNGGCAIYPTFPRGPQQTPDGDTTLFSAWERGDTGQGSFHRFQGDMEPITLYGDFIETILRGLETLHPLTKRALAVQHPDRVFVSALETNKIVLLNYRDEPARVRLDGLLDEEMPPYSIRVLGEPGQSQAR